jgi:hypothetical protein
MNVTVLSRDGDAGLLVGSRSERLAGRWSARAVIGITAVYAAVMVAGFGSMGNLVDPLPDPYLAVAELLILLLAPAMVVLMAAVHACTPVHLRMFSLIAFGWMLVTACLTMTVHVVQLVVARRIDPDSVPGFARLFEFAWPSMWYAVDVVAWDLLLGLSLLFAAFVFTGRRYRAVRWGLLASAALCLVGLVGPAIDVIAWRELGIFGYVVVFPVACLALSRAFAPPTAAPPTAAADTALRGVAARDELPAGRS